jgi:hypothetical protein
MSDDLGTEELGKSKRANINLNSNLNNSGSLSAYSVMSPFLKSSNNINSEYKFTDLGYLDLIKKNNTAIITTSNN